MKKTKTILVICLTLLMLNACSSISEGMSDGKRKGSDEFLIKKKAPLVLPPSFGELPLPTTSTKKNAVFAEESKSSIEEMISQGSSADTGQKNNNLSKSIEKSIIEKINEK
tara:strand:- start:128 stop:460 length:333 start_codon:yes stop_codon:yes gene_type:complete